MRKNVRLTDDGSVLRSVQRADDNEAKAFVLFAVDDDIIGLQGDGTLQGEVTEGGGTLSGVTGQEAEASSLCGELCCVDTEPGLRPFTPNTSPTEGSIGGEKERECVFFAPPSVVYTTHQGNRFSSGPSD